MWHGAQEVEPAALTSHGGHEPGGAGSVGDGSVGTSVGPSVGASVGPSVGASVGAGPSPGKHFMFHASLRWHTSPEPQYWTPEEMPSEGVHTPAAPAQDPHQAFSCMHGQVQGVGADAESGVRDTTTRRRSIARQQGEQPTNMETVGGRCACVAVNRFGECSPSGIDFGERSV